MRRCWPRASPCPGVRCWAGRTHSNVFVVSRPVHGMMVLLMPDSFHQLTGLAPEALTNRIVDAEAVLPPDWLPMLHDVQAAPDDATSLAPLDAFLATAGRPAATRCPCTPTGMRTGPRTWRSAPSCLAPVAACAIGSGG